MLIVVATMFVVLFALLGGGLWIGWTLAATGTILLALFRDIPLDKLLAQYAWNILTTQELLALPMFILMGEILFQSRLSRSLFQGLAPWAGLLPGRLLHVNVVGCSIFAAAWNWRGPRKPCGVPAPTVAAPSQPARDAARSRSCLREMRLQIPAQSGTAERVLLRRNAL